MLLKNVNLLPDFRDLCVVTPNVTTKVHSLASRNLKVSILSFLWLLFFSCLKMKVESLNYDMLCSSIMKCYDAHRQKASGFADYSAKY